MFCKNCGAQIDDNSVFCASCGGKVSEGQPQQEITPAPASAVAYSAAVDGTLPRTKSEYGIVLDSTVGIVNYLEIVRWAAGMLMAWLFIRSVDDFSGWELIALPILLIVGWRYIIKIYVAFKLKSIYSKEYSSFTDETASVKIVPCLFSSLSKVGVTVQPHSEYENSLTVKYSGRQYRLEFSNNPGGYFNVYLDTDDHLTGKLLKHNCADIPIIVFYVQDALKKAVGQQ